MELGDKNTQFFHKFASHRRNVNTIWSINDSMGTKMADPKSIEVTGFSHFKKHLEDPSTSNIADQLKVLRNYPSLFSKDDGEKIGCPATLEEIRDILFAFKKDKAPGPDGWFVEIFTTFWDIMGLDILEMVNFTRTEGWIAGGINLTFITLIPKCNKPATFDDSRPIALCNLVYKVISKLIANMIKPFLSHWMSTEQFAFLDDRQVLDVVGITQEVLHTVKPKKLNSLILKIDLVKTYDLVNWDFLKLVLLQIGLPILIVNWIMACVKSACFSELINGNPTPFFKSSRGLRQGCPLSPLLFLLIIEGLSLLIGKARNEKTFNGVKIIRDLSITHLLFVDEAVMFGSDSVEDWKVLADLLNLFCSATGMLISPGKSIFICNIQNNPVLTEVQNFLPFQATELDGGIKYLGYFIKPICYKIHDWRWLITKLEKRINLWLLKYLSLGGRLIMLKAVLSSLPAYWALLAKIPQVVLRKLNSLMFQFLWSGNLDGGHYHLSNWISLEQAFLSIVELLFCSSFDYLEVWVQIQRLNYWACGVF